MESDSDEEFSFTPPTIREAANKQDYNNLGKRNDSLHAAIIRTDQTINSLDYLFNVKDNFKYQRKCGHLKILQAPIVP
ncbi:hypothetical protein MTP99_005850 [Tenebrio molitor]|nr:hypothetical protein MTP99_005850 [Tenebrio molitor]